MVEPTPMDQSDPVDNYLAIRDEVRQYDNDLAERPELIAVSKCELPDADDVQQRLREATGRDVMKFSSVTGQGLNELTRRAFQLLTATRQKP
jgi:GTP-binding protein